MSAAPFYLSIALPVPLDKCFDYLPLKDTDMSQYQAGIRVAVPFGPRQLVGLIVDIHQSPQIDPSKLKPIQHIIDRTPTLPKDLYQLGHWLHQYYHQPLGECLHTLLPVLLRKDHPAQMATESYIQLNTSLPDLADLKRAPRQIALLEHILETQQTGHWQRALVAEGYTPAIIKGLEEKGFIHIQDRASFQPQRGEANTSALELNQEQKEALTHIRDAQGFQPLLLEGVTGSGKTEVYLQATAPFIEQNKQVLIIVPEIGLTPQTVKRFAKRFSADIVLLHSQLTDRERLDAWLLAREHTGERAQIIIGTRSAIFTPAPNLAAIIIDEEHDHSFKQQDGIRYNGRDVAVYRAKQKNVPIILGSATPNLDSLHNALTGKYQHLRLTERAGDAEPPKLHILDIKKQPVHHGLADHLIPEIQSTLTAGHQVLVFVNRRGFAPTLYCPDCGWISECRRCDAKMTLHQKPAHLHCHHCDYKQAMPNQCPSCLSREIHPIGAGTERIENHLSNVFQNVPVIRIDRDSTQNKHAMETLLEPVRAGQPCIMVGTQMLAKGHHFPKVALVIMVNLDAGFFSADYRAMEKTAQLILQVAGRAGRERIKGKAVIQTEFADHPLLHLLSEENYHALALALLQERHEQQLPPYGFQVLLRADSTQPREAEQFLHRIKELLKWHQHNLGMSFIQTIGPLPPPMELRSGRFRSQLWIHSPHRKPLHQFLDASIQSIYEIKGFHKVRWSIDIDPIDSL